MNYLFRLLIKRKRKAVITNNSTKAQLVKLSGILFTILIGHTWLMIHFEGLSLSDAAWLTITSATTVGYGDFSAQTIAGRLSTFFLIYIAGIAILAQCAALYFERRYEIKDRKHKGEWSWMMEDHIVFINCPNEAGEEYYYQAIKQLRSSHLEIADAPVILLCDNFSDGLPERLRKLNVVHSCKRATDDNALQTASVLAANTVIVLARNANDAESDSLTFDITSRLRDRGVKGRIICEAVRDCNRDRLRKAGADNVLRPIRSYPELLIRTILSPGSEQIVEDLFDSSGEECVRYNVQLSAKWGNLIKAMVDEDIGTPLGYENREVKVISNAHPDREVNTNAVFVIVRDDNLQTDDVVQAKLETRLAL